ncbi:fatty acid-binding protein [Candidatus Phytoplasma luffae]|uniref:Fatty acid-binding protein n=1 Tax=Loofah witches'-broom phytoplasma TaxID=35773 RepID=A0A975FIZ9_LOWBP|nr:DegV family protein [Candidatus Phytoplasma luffae]QTX02759.1 fatty acid-binding protein [Candidatus Phytoplasma luffae]
MTISSIKKDRKVSFVVDSTIGDNIDFDLFPFDISIIPLNIFLKGKEILDKKGNDFFLYYSNQGHQITTSQPNPQLFLKFFKEKLKSEPEHLFCLTLSKKLSGTFNSACKAKELLGNPNNITIIDTENIGPGMFFTLNRIYKYITDTELSYEEISNKVLQEQKQGILYFSVSDLKQLKINKRISKFKFFIGSLLKIKPILKFNQGIITIEKNVRSQKNCFFYLINYILEFQKLVSRPIEVKLIYVIDDLIVQKLKLEIQKLKNKDIKVSIYGSISNIIAVHLGAEGFGIYLNII